MNGCRDRAGQRALRRRATTLVAAASQEALRVAIDVGHHEVGQAALRVAHGGQDSHGVEAALDGRPEPGIAAAQASSARLRRRRSSGCG